MIKSYITIILRIIRKQRAYAAIHVLGMTVGFTAFLFIALYVLDELSYDRFHAHASRIYQVGRHNKFGETEIRSASTCPPLAPAMLAEIPEVESVLRLTSAGKPVLRYGEKMFTEDKVFVAEKNFFTFFSFELMSGHPETALREPHSVVLAQSIVRKYFGDESPLDKLITVDGGLGQETYRVTGVAADCPGNSHLKFNLLLSGGPDSYFSEEAWLNSGMYTYFLLRENASIGDVEEKLEGLVVKYVAPEVQKFLGSSLDQFRGAGGIFRYFTTPLTDIHLKSTSQDDIEPAGSITFLYVFGGIGFFVMAIACINFMNLSTAQALGKAREIGLRKTLGALRVELMVRFFAESFLFSAAAMVVSVSLCALLLPAFNLLAGKELSIGQLLDVKFVVGALAMMLMAGLLAGIHPAFYLTSFRPVDALKGKLRAGVGGNGIRSALVVFQFTISVLLIIVTSVVYNQITFMKEQQLGMDKESVLVIEDLYRLGEKQAAFREAIEQQVGVIHASYAAIKLPMRNNTMVMRSGTSDGEHQVAAYYAGYESQQVLRLTLTEGRFFSRSFPTDTAAVVINEAAAKELDFDSPIGEEILNSPNAYIFVRYRIIGVLKDFTFESYHSQVRPLAIFLDRGPSGLLLVRYEGNASRMVERVSSVWKQYAPNEPLAYTFMDDNFDKLYRSEEKTGRLLGVFSGLAIFIACLGLFALAAYTAERRTKEIGIRKVLGASMRSVLFLLTKEFVTLVVVALIPACALGWWISMQWLSGFAYRIDIGIAIFLMAAVAAISLALVTVGFQSVKAAQANPADSLQNE